MLTCTEFTVQTNVPLLTKHMDTFFLNLLYSTNFFSSFQTFHSHFGYSGWIDVLGSCSQRNNYCCPYQLGCRCVHLNMPFHVTRLPAEGVQTADVRFCCNHVHCFHWCGCSNIKRDKIDRRINTRTKLNRVSHIPVFGTTPPSWSRDSVLGRVIWHLYCRRPAASQRVHVFVSWNLVSSLPTLWVSVADNIFPLQSNGQIMG